MTTFNTSLIMFDIDKMTNFALESITHFAGEQPEEVFYGFAIDANLMCLNSEEQFTLTLESYRQKSGNYTDKAEIESLRHNTGDWKYQGFAEFSKDTGFDMDLYLEHYHSDDEEQQNSDYSIAIEKVLENLKESNVFSSLKTTTNFYITKVEHNY